MSAVVFDKEQSIEVVELLNNTGADLAQYEFAVIGGLACVANDAIASAKTGAFTISPLVLQIDEFVTAEDTFGTVSAPVYWNASTKQFSDTLQNNYILVGVVLVAKDSNGVVIMLKFRNVTDDAADIAAAVANIATNASGILTNAAAIALNTTFRTESSGVFFKRTATLTATGAATPVELLAAADVGTGRTAYVLGIIAKVNGGTAWTGGTGTIVTIQDDAGTPVIGVTIAAAGLIGNAFIDLSEANTTVGDAVALGTGFTAEKGLDVAGDAAFGAGSDLEVTVFGYIA
jgi:hypothetical protein